LRPIRISLLGNLDKSAQEGRQSASYHHSRPSHPTVT
jgi:hypothetical protein